VIIPQCLGTWEHAGEYYYRLDLVYRQVTEPKVLNLKEGSKPEKCLLNSKNNSGLVSDKVELESYGEEFLDEDET